MSYDEQPDDTHGECANEIASLREKLKAAEELAEFHEHRADNLHAAQTCVSCKSLICPPMQCGSCIEKEAPVPGMPDRPATTTLRLRAKQAEGAFRAAESREAVLAKLLSREELRVEKAEVELGELNDRLAQSLAEERRANANEDQIRKQLADRDAKIAKLRDHLTAMVSLWHRKGPRGLVRIDGNLTTVERASLALADTAPSEEEKP